MLTFKQFVSEKKAPPQGNNDQQIIDMIKRDCQPWLSAAGKNLAWRGISIAGGKGFTKAVFKTADYGVPDMLIGAVRTDRVPKDSPMWLHNALNKHFQKSVGIPLRSASLFCTGSSMLAENYGHVYAVFPIGNFNYAWSKMIVDPTHTFYIGPYQEDGLPQSGDGLNELIENEFHEYSADMGLWTFDVNDYIKNIEDNEKAQAVWQQFCEDFIEHNELWKYNTGIKDALTKYKDHEIMIVCDKYYLVELDVVDRIRKHLK